MEIDALAAYILLQIMFFAIGIAIGASIRTIRERRKRIKEMLGED